MVGFDKVERILSGGDVELDFDGGRKALNFLSVASTTSRVVGLRWDPLRPERARGQGGRSVDGVGHGRLLIGCST